MVEKDEDITIGQLLGKIFYAAAIADKVIREEEIIRMNDLIAENWKSEEEEILKSFYQCINFGYESQVVFSEIDAHKKTYPNFFDKEMVECIMKTSYKIVASFSSTNKSEIIFISQLRNALEQVEK